MQKNSLTLHISLGLTVFFAQSIFSCEPAFSQNLFENIQSLKNKGALVSGLVVNIRTGEVLSELNPDARLSPASVTKVVLGAAALEKFGSDFSFTTNIYSTGTVKNGIIDGDIIFEGVGDPYLTNEKLWFLTTDIARRGIKQINGNLILNTSLFGEIKRDANREAGRLSSTHAYDAPLSAAAVNFSVLGIVGGVSLSGEKNGSIALEPYELESVKLSGGVTTSASPGSKWSAGRSRSGQKDLIQVSGALAAGSAPSRLYRSVSEADEYSGAVLRAFLKAAGIKINGTVKIDKKPLSGRERMLSNVEGFPLDWQLRGLFKVSNNFIADMLTIQLDVGPEKKPGGTLTGGASQLEKYMHKILLESKNQNSKADFKNLVIASGSGLTPENRLSARDVTAVLGRMYKNRREFPSFLAALPIPGSEGTVRKRFKGLNEQHLRDSLRAKTGTLTEPVDAVALAGYSRLKDGDWVALAVIVNGTSEQPSFGVETIRNAIDADLAHILPVER